jgi:VWFA-related protein
MAVCLAVGPLGAQVRFRTSVEYVELDAVVTDKDGHPVKNLTKDDFVITESARPQTIANLQFVSIPPAHRTIADVKASAPTIDVTTNTHPPLGRQWVLAIDDLHIIETHIVQTKKVIQDFLESLPPSDQVAIVFVGRSDLSQDFTSDLDAQMRTVNRIRDALGFAPDAGDDIEQRSRHRYALATVDVLKNICASLVRSTYPRKALVYVSEGMTYPIGFSVPSGYLDNSRDTSDANEVAEQLISSFESARKAGVPVYTVDPRGIPDCTAVRGYCNFPSILPAIRRQENMMRTIAENTGGLAFVERSNMTAAIQELVADNSNFYLLGYYPEPLVRDGKHHDVKVSIPGHPEYRVRAKGGYDAPRAVAPTGVETKKALEDALAAALPTSNLELRAFAAPVVQGPHGMQTIVTIEVTYPVPPDGSSINDVLHFGGMALDHDGKVKASSRREFHFSATPKDAADVTYVINEVIELPSQPLTLRVGVASQLLDRVGTIHLPVEVINPTNDRMQMSAVVLAFAGPKRQAVMREHAFNTLVPAQPTTTRVFSASDTLQVYAPIFWGSPRETTIDASVAIRHGDQAPTPRHLRVSAPENGDTHHHAAIDTTLPLAGLAPGSYVLEVQARLANGQTAKRSVAFEIK